MMETNSTYWRHEFHRALPTIERVIEAVCRRKRLIAAEAEEFRSYVMLKLVERDYARLRKFGERSCLATYLNVVVRRLLLDFRIGQWGKWRPSTRAKTYGEIGIQLEQLVYRDGFTFAEAYEILSQRAEFRASREDYWKTFRSLPCRKRRQWVDVGQLADCVPAEKSHDPLEAKEQRDVALATRAVLVAALRQANPVAQKVIWRRFHEGVTISLLAEEHGIKPRDMSRLIAKTLEKTREALVAAGVSWEAVRDALSVPEGRRVFEELLDSEQWSVPSESTVAA